MSGEKNEGLLEASKGTSVSELNPENVGLIGSAPRRLLPPLPAALPCKPTFDRVLLRPLGHRTKSDGGLHLVREHAYIIGQVLAKGDGILLQNGTFETGPFQEGQVVGVAPGQGGMLSLDIGSDQYWLVQQSAIVCVFEDAALPWILPRPDDKQERTALGTTVIAPAVLAADGGEPRSAAAAEAAEVDNDER